MSFRVGLGSVFRQAASPRLVRNQPIRNVLTRRYFQTQSLQPSAETEILNQQRLKRPSSPHFTIYQPQLTWLGSIANRVTGVQLSVTLYAYALAYLVAPEVFSAANVVEFIHGLPEFVKIAGKVVFAAPFSYHAWNGMRHLLWDTGYFLTLKGAYQSGYAVLAATAASTVGLLFL